MGIIPTAQGHREANMFGGVFVTTTCVLGDACHYDNHNGLQVQKKIGDSRTITLLEHSGRKNSRLHRARHPEAVVDQERFRCFIFGMSFPGTVARSC